MPYTLPVKFSQTNCYGSGPVDEDDVYTVAEFSEHVRNRSFIDYDGYGRPVKDNLADETVCIHPSTIERIPEDATHIVWYNR